MDRIGNISFIEENVKDVRWRELSGNCGRRRAGQRCKTRRAGHRLCPEIADGDAQRARDTRGNGRAGVRKLRTGTQGWMCEDRARDGGRERGAEIADTQAVRGVEDAAGGKGGARGRPQFPDRRRAHGIVSRLRWSPCVQVGSQTSE